jgi:hypothetical protein
MKVPFTLEPEQELLLRILYVTGPLQYFAIERVFYTIRKSDSDFDKLLKILVDAVKPSSDAAIQTKQRRSGFRRLLNGLMAVGLVVLSGDSGDTRLSSGADTTLIDSRVALTSEGKRVAGSIKEGRSVILRPAPRHRNTVFVACAFGY